ncbi:DUF2834 domain-containing protein [Mycolicibacter kumamotonensis]|jgi:hypothetical protein|uniref:DUF2834 domain-containing protein n=1 Tax=Mycolicibacter kumamotonensis TaxID=354243 RepID=A0A1B8SJC1_9MYCO|nr:DUF2834 domain-containing protein [Mycolicibacter kumamotonensis]NDJ89412.1 DUF2834 domain-containing protein [Mycolicibacter kumamotonensis]OBY32819.1 hypothetical protein ACT18_05165 [Mycolicibacter kumamotonensis]ORA77867.1 hypothetical protein BST28_16685 [Mycolicibacter kumamotonensis]
MDKAAKIRCAIYAAIAVVALIATWSQNLAYDFAEVFPRFLQETTVTPASRSITADIVLLLLAAAFLMVLEARRHNVRFVWAYIAGGLLIAISVTFPLFLIARERRLAAENSETPALGVVDKVLLTVLTLAMAAAALWIDTR